MAACYTPKPNKGSCLDQLDPPVDRVAPQPVPTYNHSAQRVAPILIYLGPINISRLLCVYSLLRPDTQRSQSQRRSTRVGSTLLERVDKHD